MDLQSASVTESKWFVQDLQRQWPLADPETR